jgi:hypothetical protein
MIQKRNHFERFGRVDALFGFQVSIDGRGLYNNNFIAAEANSPILKEFQKKLLDNYKNAHPDVVWETKRKFGSRGDKANPQGRYKLTIQMSGPGVYSDRALPILIGHMEKLPPSEQLAILKQVPEAMSFPVGPFQISKPLQEEPALSEKSELGYPSFLVEEPSIFNFDSETIVVFDKDLDRLLRNKITFNTQGFNTWCDLTWCPKKVDKTIALPLEYH